MKTVEHLAKELKTLLEECCEPNLLKDNYFGDSKVPCISYEVSLNHCSYIVITLHIRMGAFGEVTIDNERLYYNGEFATTSELRNQIFNALTFQGSPYYLGKRNKFYKKLIVL